MVWESVEKDREKERMCEGTETDEAENITKTGKRKRRKKEKERDKNSGEECM